MYIMIKIVFGNKYYYNILEQIWEGLKDNATPITYEQCNYLKVEFPNDTYFVKVK